MCGMFDAEVSCFEAVLGLDMLGAAYHDLRMGIPRLLTEHMC